MIQGVDSQDINEVLFRPPDLLPLHHLGGCHVVRRVHVARLPPARGPVAHLFALLLLLGLGLCLDLVLGHAAHGVRIGQDPGQRLEFLVGARRGFGAVEAAAPGARGAIDIEEVARGVGICVPRGCGKWWWVSRCISLSLLFFPPSSGGGEDVPALGPFAEDKNALDWWVVTHDRQSDASGRNDSLGAMFGADWRVV